MADNSDPSKGVASVASLSVRGLSHSRFSVRECAGKIAADVEIIQQHSAIVDRLTHLSKPEAGERVNSRDTIWSDVPALQVMKASRTSQRRQVQDVAALAPCTEIPVSLILVDVVPRRAFATLLQPV